MTKLGDIVHVVWMDTCYQSGWHPRDSEDILDEPEGSVAESVGFLLRDGPHGLTLAAMRSGGDADRYADDQVGELTTIPRGAVVRVTPLARVRLARQGEKKPGRSRA